jgi:lipopolysaccharide/colanic/teichoic acid biosynthesis glycosyltransferase
VLDRQQRIGLRGRVFTRLKFRSARLDAERDGAAHGVRKHGARVTRVGAFIRRSRIDELPQLFSVLAGDMSLVGPRPETPSVAERLRKEIPLYDARHAVKPGMTGYAQVHRGEGASFDDVGRRHQLDLHYVKSNSLGLDLLVLVETVRVVLGRNGR